MAGVYSARLAAQGGTEGWFTSVVPAGHRAVIRSLTAANQSGTAHTFAAGIGGWTLWAAQVPGGSSFLSAVLHQVAYAGENVNIYIPGASCYVVVGGYLLSEVAGSSSEPEMITLGPYADPQGGPR